ncbi:hypothetical protein [Vibrio parahaemolyticus]|uniref:hypothetical protein n=1 Tax=Vibrio parahaemolyticus TaxID=670 RepID=UPI001E581A99|nr:hypothetical protein [Vibrio parahaemolyticus]
MTQNRIAKPSQKTWTLALNILLWVHFSSLATNAFYTANSGLSRTLPPSFLTKEKQILALIFMKKIEK